MVSGLVFFSWIHPPKFSFLRCRLQNKTQQKRGISRSQHERIGVRECNAEEARVNNELSCCWYRRERDRFLLSATFSEYSLLVERVSRRAIVHLFKRVSNFFPSFLWWPGGQSTGREREKITKITWTNTSAEGGVEFFFKTSFSSFFLSLSLPCKLKRRTCKECPPVFQHDYKNIK